MKRVAILVFVLGVHITSRSHAQKAYDFAPVDQKIQCWIDSGYYDGASLIVGRVDTILHKKYYGTYNSQTVVHIASAGKWLAAAAIAAVVQEGKLGWDDPVERWIPEFTDLKGKATLRQLLSHTAGFPDYQPRGARADNYQSLRESVAYIVNLPADTLPGTKFLYGGLAMQVAGRMAELATGKIWEAIFQEKIAGPLGMIGTHFTPVDPTPGHNPMLGGGARCRLDDYGCFLDMILNDGVYKGKQVLSKASIVELESNQVRDAIVRAGEYVQVVRKESRNDIYGLGQWREKVDQRGNALVISSPSWAGAYPWIDKENGIYGFFLARISNDKNGFSGFYQSPVLSEMAGKCYGR
ncbi:beta-lactamase family protein [Dyadobacter sp. CY345]|uniref:serine hydrolase domain-containing protein n=1 Tax=Dyadobacter sp. CY345 TaxID=2909335 RepID=UPI001F315BFB|nr:serine hydrolase domain-containing protein [Dyadobacter sp. CY345]MCF2443254.1 beta-lactamase family protein [Dyadobacter sp. CY345]